MLHTQSIADQSFHFNFEHNWSSSRTSKMNNRDHRRSTGSYPPLPSLIEPTPAGSHHGTPRTFAPSPSIVQSSDENGLQLFQVFPDTYGYNPTYAPLPAPVPQPTQYLQPPELVYSSSAPSSSPGPLHLPSPHFDSRYTPGIYNHLVSKTSLTAY